MGLPRSCDKRELRNDSRDGGGTVQREARHGELLGGCTGEECEADPWGARISQREGQPLRSGIHPCSAYRCWARAPLRSCKGESNTGWELRKTGERNWKPVRESTLTERRVGGSSRTRCGGGSSW